MLQFETFGLVGAANPRCRVLPGPMWPGDCVADRDVHVLLCCTRYSVLLDIYGKVLQLLLLPWFIPRIVFCFCIAKSESGDGNCKVLVVLVNSTSSLEKRPAAVLFEGPWNR